MSHELQTDTELEVKGPKIVAVHRIKQNYGFLGAVTSSDAFSVSKRIIFLDFILFPRIQVTQLLKKSIIIDSFSPNV